jgi:hypothetical protein
MTATARFALPLLHAGQAQKEMFHNEAVTGIDLLLHPVVQGVGIDTPPASPEPGEAWVVGNMPTGDWAGHDGKIAAWTDGGWRFATPCVGMEIWVESLARPLRYHAGSGWQVGVIAASGIEIDGVQVVGERGAAIAVPTGGATIDEPARVAIAAIISTLQAHGLIASVEL